MRTSVALVLLLVSQIAAADIAVRVAAGKAALSSAEARSYQAGILGDVMPAAMRACATPGSNVATQDWQMTVVGNVSSGGKIGEIEIAPANTITACIAEFLKKATLPAPPATMVGAKGFPIQVEMVVTNGAKAAARIAVSVTPVFSQLVGYSHPAGFVPAAENADSTTYVQRSVLKGESAEKWTQMITLSGAKDLAIKPDMTPKYLLERMGGVLRGNCPSTFATKPLGSLKISGYDAFLALMGCGSMKSGPPRSEVVLIVAIKGKSDMYTIQWAERSIPSVQAPVLDNAKWSPRFQQLGQIRVCDRVPGEVAPYPSCASPPAGK